MPVFFRRHGVLSRSVIVTITGLGYERGCYAIINGKTQYREGVYGACIGDTITFGVYGSSTRKPGTITINGTEVLSVTSGSVQTYGWTVPRGISTIKISMEYNRSYSYGKITVTTA